MLTLLYSKKRLKFVNKVDTVVSHMEFNSNHYEKCQFTLVGSSWYLLQVHFHYELYNIGSQLCQLYALWENSIACNYSLMITVITD